MAATLDQVIQQLQTTYQPQIESIQKQQAALPGQQQAQEQALGAQKDQGFTDILNQARARGTGVAFGGIPLQEQSNYLSTNYLPALANLKSSYAQQGNSLQDALNQIYERRNTQAQSIYDTQRAFEEQQRQFNESQAFAREQAAAQERQATAARAASAASAYSPSIGSQTAEPQYIGNNDYRGHLNYLAQKAGNADAAVALKYVGNDGRYNLNPWITNPAIIQALDRIGATNVWKG